MTPPTVPGLSPDDAERALDAVNTMYTVRAVNDVASDRFMDDLCESLIAYKELNAGSEDQFRARITRLLEIDSLSIAAKATALQLEHANLFCSARVLTDARPVYGKEVSDPPVAMIITHELKIGYHEADGRLGEIYIGLGSQDLRSLMYHLGRAETKAKSLRTALDGSQLKFIDPQE